MSPTAAGSKKKPHTTPRLIDPSLIETRRGNFAVFAAKLVRLPHARNEIAIILPQRAHYVERFGVAGVFAGKTW